MRSPQHTMITRKIQIATHYYVQENLKDLLYLTDGSIAKLADVKKDEAGILTTSRMSTTYRLLSSKFKGQIPMAIISSLNSRIISAFVKERKEYEDGRRSLRTYRRNLPIPIVASNILHIQPAGKGEYAFTLYGLNFQTHFGRDTSGNRQLFERFLQGEIKLHDSSIELREKKLFFLAVFSFDQQTRELSENIRVTARLSPDIPIVAETGDLRIEIGTREEYLYRRQAIQDSMHRAQVTMKFNRGGKGREKKMQVLQRFHDLEKNYVNTRLHQYSARLISWCLQHNAGLLVLQGQSEKEKQAKEDPFLLRNWTYYGLKKMISYKAAKYGITVKIE